MSAPAPEKIVVAYIGPLTGPAAPWGLATTRGGQYFLDQANAKGGVKVGGKSYTFELISYDHGLDPAKAQWSRPKEQFLLTRRIC
jgi:branched-chain amino acid transport system substrate-binding protein